MRVLTRPSGIGLLMALTAVGAACSSDGGPSGNAGSIEISAGPSTLTVPQGGSGSVTLTLIRGGGFSADVNVEVSGLPTGITATVTPAQLTGNTTSATVAVSVANSVPVGTYTATVRASATGVGDATATYTIVVTAPPNFSLAVAPTTISIQAGGSNQGTVTITRTNFTGTVDLSLDNLPANVTVAFNAASTTGTTSAMTVTVGAQVAPANYTITVRGTAPALLVGIRTTTFTLTVTAPPAMALAALPNTFSLAQGATTGNTATITLTRSGGFADVVNVSVASSPTGVTGTFNPASFAAGATTTTLTINVPGDQTPGVYTLTITATAAGVTNAVTTVTVTVAQGNITFAFCAPAMLPVWFVFQDGNGAWTVVTGTNNSYRFNIASGRGGVGYVSPYASGGFLTNIRFGTTAELQAFGATLCVPPSGKTLNFTVTGNAGVNFDHLNVALGTAVTTRGPTNDPFVLNDVPNGPQDLIATKDVNNILTKVIIRRGVDYPANSNVPVLDFAATANAEWFAPERRNLTINGLAGQTATSEVYYLTGTGGGTFRTRGFLEAIINSPDVNRSIPAVPLANQAPSDLHEIGARSFSAGDPFAAHRSSTLFIKDPAATTILTLPTAGPAPVVTRNVTTPYPMPRLQYTTQADVDDLITLDYVGDGGGANRREANWVFTRGYLGITSALDFQFPNWSGLPQFQVTWMLQSATIFPRMEALGFSGLPFTQGLTTTRLFWDGL